MRDIRLHKTLQFLFLLLVFSAYAFSQEAQQANPSSSTTAAAPVSDAKSDASATLIIYRPKRFTGSGLTPSVFFNGEEVARLDNGRYFVMEVPADSHKLQSSMKADPTPLEVKEGQVQFLELVIMTGTWRGGGRLIPTGESDAREAIKKLKPLDKKWAKSDKVTFEIPAAQPGN